MAKIDPAKVVIRSATENDYNAIIKLCDERFGTGYIDRNEYNRWLKYPELFLALDYDNDFVGYVCILPSTPESVSADMQLPLDEIKAECAGKKIVRCRSAVLRTEYENMGFMRMLWQKVFDNAKKLGYNISYCPAWKYNGFVPMDHLLTKLGFEAIAEKQMLWYNEENYKCVICGGKCKCPAIIYKLNIS